MFKKFCFSLIVSSFLLTAACGEDPAGDRTSQFRSAEVISQRLAEALGEATDVPGMAIAIGYQGEIIWETYLGYADLENQVPVSENSLFRTASVAKIITATALMTLVRDGKIDLDKSIYAYVPNFPLKDKGITPRRLAGHLAGIRHYLDKDQEFTHFDTVTAGLAMFQEDDLVAKPGETYRYSSFGYALLSAVIEGAADKPFLDYVDSAVLTPLGMDKTTADNQHIIIPGRVSFYEKGDTGENLNTRFVDPSYKWGAGGFLSRPAEIVSLGFGVLDKNFFPAEIQAEIFKSQTTLSGEATGVGIGWRIGEDFAGRRVFHHAGNMPGARSVLVVWPDYDLVIAIMTNERTVPADIKRSAELIAQPFLAKIENQSIEIETFAEGKFSYSGIGGDEEVSGTFEFACGSFCQGHMTNPDYMQNVVFKNSLKAEETSAIPYLFERDGKIIAVMATPFGLFDIYFEKTEDALSATFGKNTLPMTLQTQPADPSP